MGLGTVIQTCNAASRWEKVHYCRVSGALAGVDFTTRLFLRLGGAYGLRFWLIKAVITKLAMYHKDI